jgi:cystathionine beta-lyase
MTYDFDEEISRRGTLSIKHDFAAERGMPDDLLPMWVADMDFRAPTEVIEGLAETAAHGIFGYSEVKADYARVVIDWFARRFGWRPEPTCLIKVPGVVYALSAAVRSLTEPGDAVVIQTPVYYPFSRCVTDNGRRLATNPLKIVDGRYRMDLDDLEKKIETEKIKMLVLCSPHNPVGRVWTREELADLASLCLKKRVLIVSDEIHCDFVFGERRHHVLNSIDPALDEISIVLTAPSKTFNLAALHAANVFAPNPALRGAFKNEVAASGLSQLNVMGLVACRRAYEFGESWLEELLKYLEGNIRAAEKFFRERLPELKPFDLEGTYLLWFDCRDLGLDHAELNRLIIGEAKLWLDDGAMFGPEGAGFQRMNVACPRRVLMEALERLAQAVERLRGLSVVI